MQENKETGKRRGSPATRAAKGLKKVVAGVLCATMVFTGMPVLTSLADEADGTIGASGEVGASESVGVSTVSECNCSEYTSEFPEPDADGVITLNSCVELTAGYEVEESEEVTIDLNGHTVTLADEATVSGNTGLFMVNGGSLNVTGKGGTVTGTQVRAFYVDSGSLTVDDVVMTGNSSASYSANDRQGGAVYANSSKVTVKNCDILENSAYRSGSSSSTGGGIYINGGILTLSDSNISENEDRSGGGAVRIAGDCQASLTNCLFVSNTCTDSYGGGVYVSDSADAIFESCTFKGNTTGSYGGGVCAGGTSNVTFTNCRFEENEASTRGGGFSTYSNPSFSFDNCIFAGNMVDGYTRLDIATTSSGGGLFSDSETDEDTTIKNCTFSGNSSSARGGGIEVLRSTGNLTISNCLVEENTALQGAGIVVLADYDEADVIINSCQILNNISTENNGGGLFISDALVEVSDTEISGNSAVEGGGVFIENYSELGMGAANSRDEETSTTFTNCTITDNKAENAGGGISVESGTMMATEGNVICNNTAEVAGADIYVNEEHECKLLLSSAPEEIYKADGKNHTIDGWYVDEENDRYTPSTDGADYLYEEYEDIESEADGDPVYLIASYTVNSANVTFYPGAFGSLKGDAEFEVNIGATIDDSGYSVPEVEPDDGFEFDYWVGSDGVYYDSDEILALEITADITFTAVYKVADKDIGYGTLSVTKVVENMPEGGDISYNFALVMESMEAESSSNASHIVVETGNNASHVETASNASRKVVEFQLKDGETATFYGIPEGWAYEVVETSQSSAYDTDASAEGAEATKFIDEDGFVYIAATMESGDEVTVTYVNTYEETKDNPDTGTPEPAPEPIPVPDESAPFEFTKTSSRGETTVSVGTNLTYTISYKNDTDESATITIVDPLDAGLTYSSASDGGVYDESDRTVTWTIEDVKPGEEGSVTVTARVNYTGRTEGRVTNTAELTVEGLESGTYEANASASNTVSRTSSSSSGSGSSSGSSSSGSVTNVNTGKTGHWILEGGYLTLPDGSHPSNEYLNVDGEVWAFYTYGYAVARRHTEYYTSAALATVGYIPEVTGTWETIGWWFEYDDGTYPHDEWAQLEYNGLTYWYHFDVDGWMDDGWFTENGTTYYLDPVFDGWRGHMMTGWQEIDGEWYYFESSGALLKNGTTPDGYTVDANGRWIG